MALSVLKQPFDDYNTYNYSPIGYSVNVYPFSAEDDFSLPSSFIEHRKKIKLGTGKSCYTEACKLLFSWGMVNLPENGNKNNWVSIEGEKYDYESKRVVSPYWNAPQGDVNVTVRIPFLNLKWHNPCRICYRLVDSVIQLQDSEVSNIVKGKTRPSYVSAVAYGTLKGHLLKGEERFMIEFRSKELMKSSSKVESNREDKDESNLNDDSVWFEIYSFSKPSGLLGYLGIPTIRMLQSNFLNDITERMASLVSELTQDT